MKFVLSVCAYVIALQASAADLPTILDGRGIWMRHSRDLNSQLIDRMRLAGIKRVHVMGSKTFKQRTCSKAEPRIVDDADTIAKTVTVLKAAGFVSILTLYVPPTKTAVDSLMAEVIP